MEVEFDPQNEEQFKKDAIGNYVITEVTDLSTNKCSRFSRKVTKYWTSPCRTNIVTDHRIRALKGDHYKIKSWIDTNTIEDEDLHKHGIKRRILDETPSYIKYHEKSGSLDTVSIEELNNELEKSITSSRYSSAKDREERLDKANKQPEQVEIRTRGFRRNADVIVTVLNRANGICERCKQKAPFVRKKDNTPYLEVHHKQQLSEGGDDSVENAIAVCPNCHRELHFG